MSDETPYMKFSVVLYKLGYQLRGLRANPISFLLDFEEIQNVYHC